MGKEKRELAVINCSTGWGGLEMNTLRLSEWLCETNEVTLFCSKNSPLEKAARQSFVKVNVIDKKPSKKFPLLSAWKLSRQLKKRNIHFLMFIENKDLSLGAWIKFFSGNRDIKVIYQQQMQLGISKRDIIHTLRYQKINAWVSPLHWLAEEVTQKTRINKSKIHVIPLGINVEELQAKVRSRVDSRTFFDIETSRPVFGILGRIDRKKNQHILLEAVLELKKRGQEVDALIVGEPTVNITDTYFEELKKFVAENKIEDQVMFRPFTTEIENFFGAVDFFVMATDKETYGMVTLEAMLYGTPVLASNSGGSVEILDHGKLGTLFEPENSMDLAMKMEEVLVNEAEVHRKTKEAKQKVEKLYNHHYECEQFNKLMDSL